MVRSRSAVAAAFLIIAVGMPGARAEGSWSDAGSLAFPRSLHTLTALADGSAVVIGGRGCPPAANLLSASFGVEIFDHATSSWRLGAQPLAPRDRHTVTLLEDGRILMAGGQVTAGICPARLHVPMSRAEVYDPTADAWEPAGAMAISRTGHSSSLLADGRVLIAGGSTAAAMEVWDPADGAWAHGGDLILPRAFHAATRLADGRVLISGGNSGGAAFALSEIVDPATGVSSPAGELLDARSGHQAIAMPDGTVLVVGGRGSEGTTLGSVESYDPVTDMWSGRAPMRTPRAFHTATLLTDGRVLVVGGSTATGAPMSSAEIYDPTSDTWTVVASTVTAHTGHVAALLADDSVLVVAGGYEEIGFTGAAERFVL